MPCSCQFGRLRTARGSVLLSSRMITQRRKDAKKGYSIGRESLAYSSRPLTTLVIPLRSRAEPKLINKPRCMRDSRRYVRSCFL